jgi:thioredoxin-related protein
MKKNLLTFAFILCTVSSLFATDFFKGNYKEALVKAQQENKLLFLYFTASWCGPCQYMQQYIFPDEGLSAYINQNYIALKLDIDTEEGKLIYIKAHQPKAPMGVPAFVIANAKEEILKKHTGGMKLNQLQEFLLKDKDETVIYKLLTDSVANEQNDILKKKPTTISKFLYSSMYSNWKPGLKIGINLMGFRSTVSNNALTTGYEFGFFMDRSFQNKNGGKDFWEAWRYNFQPGLMLTSKGGSLVLNGVENKINIHYLELGLFNSYQIKGLHRLQVSVNPYFATALEGNVDAGLGKQKLSFGNDFERTDYGLKLGLSKDFGSFKPFLGYNIGLKDVSKGVEKVYNEGFYASFALIVGK